MSITILNPHNQEPFKVRDVDLGRAVKDKQGRIFYVLRDPDGGCYAALTRVGGEKELNRYREMEARSGFKQENKEIVAMKEESIADRVTKVRSRRSKGKMLVVLILLAIVGGAIYGLTQGWFGDKPESTIESLKENIQDGVEDAGEAIDKGMKNATGATGVRLPEVFRYHMC